MRLRGLANLPDPGVIMKKTVAFLIATTFALGSVNVFAGKHMAGEKGKPSAEECKKNPKQKGCEKK